MSFWHIYQWIYQGITFIYILNQQNLFKIKKKFRIDSNTKFSSLSYLYTSRKNNMPVKEHPLSTWRYLAKLPTNNSNFGSLPSGGRHIKVTVPRCGRIGWSTIMRSICQETEPNNAVRPVLEVDKGFIKRQNGNFVARLDVELFQINFASLLFNDVRFVERYRLSFPVWRSS